MTTRICIRLNDAEQQAFAKIKGRLNDAEGFRVMLECAAHVKRYDPLQYDFIRGKSTIKTSTRNGRHIGK